MSTRPLPCAALLAAFSLAIPACVSYSGSAVQAAGKPEHVVSAEHPIANGCFRLDALPLKSLVAEVNRNNTRQLIVVNPAVEHVRLSGAVCLDRLDTLIGVLRGLGLEVVEASVPAGHRFSHGAAAASRE